MLLKAKILARSEPESALQMMGEASALAMVWKMWELRRKAAFHAGIVLFGMGRFCEARVKFAGAVDLKGHVEEVELWVLRTNRALGA